MCKCKNCNVNDATKYSKYSNGEFCSTKCARSFSTKEKRLVINEKVSKKLIGRKTKSRKTRKDITDVVELEKYMDRWKKIRKKMSETYNEKILNADYSTLTHDRLRKRILLEQDNKCNRCGLSEWLGETISLELEHIDGNHHNNSRENLEALCPNCHSLTPTWRGKNKKNNKHKISDEMLLKSLLENDFNIRQSLISVGLAAKGGNYGRCYKLKKEYDEIINN